MNLKTTSIGRLIQIRRILATLALTSLPFILKAQTTNYLIDQFDTDTAGSYTLSWGDSPPSIYWDTSVNQTTSLGPNNADSGSSQWVVDWSNADQFMIVHAFGEVLDLRLYTYISFDIRFDVASGATADETSYGYLEIDWVPQTDGWASTPNTPPGLTLPITNEWIHVSLPIDENQAKLNAVTGIGFKMQANKTGSPLTGVQTFWLDNIILGARTTSAPPPTLSIAPVTTPPGLMIVASGGGNEYNRGMVRTLDPINGTPSYSWLGQGDTPVTYALTIASYPDNNHNAFQSQIFLVPNGENDPGIDWDAPSVVFLDIQNQTNGTATGTFRYKVNTPQDNNVFYGSGALASIQCASPLGTWSLTFRNDTNVTLTGPGGVSTNFNIPDAATIQSVFVNPLSVYFGNQQNGAANAGQATTISRVQISGVAGSPEIDDTFSGTALNPDLWQVVCTVPADVFLVHSTDKYWVSWTLPDTGFRLQSSPNLTAGSWIDPGLTNIVSTTVGNRVLVPQDKLPATGAGYFRMVK